MGCKFVPTPLVAHEKLKLDDGSGKVDPTVFRSLIRCLQYLTASRPTIPFSVRLLFWFMQNPSQFHYSKAKRVLRHLKELGILAYCTLLRMKPDYFVGMGG